MDGHPVDKQLELLVQHFQRRTPPPFEALVEVQHQDGTVDLKPVSQEIGPGWTKVRVAMVGPFTVKVVPGARAVVEFLDGDLSRPVVTRYLEAAYTEVTLNATTKVKIGGPTVEIGDTGAIVKLGGGNQPVVRAGDNISGPSNAAGAVAGVVAVGGPPGKVLA